MARLVCLLAFLTVIVFDSPYVKGERGLIVTAPDVFYLDQDTSVWLNLLRDGLPSSVELYLQDYPDRRNTFNRREINIMPYTPQSVAMGVTSDDLPDPDDPMEAVLLVVTSGSWTRETRVLLSTNRYRVFIQMDKPVYTPRQPVLIVVYTLDENMLPTAIPVKLDILNPQGVVVEHADLDPDEDGILQKTFGLPEMLIHGNWSCVASYGHLFQRNRTTKFEVKEYVLPSFSVRITCPEFILPGQNITAYVTARHTFGKPVHGTAIVKIGIVKDGLTQIMSKQRKLDFDGQYHFFLAMEDFAGQFQFPGVSGSRLHLEATVVERYTGNKGSTVVRNTMFTTSPYQIIMTRSSKYMKPALPYILRMNTVYANGRTAVNVPLVVSANATLQDDRVVNVQSFNGGPNELNSREGGGAHFTLNIPPQAKLVTITVRTRDVNYIDQYQGISEMTLTSYYSPSSSYICLKPIQQLALVGLHFEVQVFITHVDDMAYLTYMVIGPGRILSQSSMLRPAGVQTTIRIEITPEMSPTIRLLVYYLRPDGEVVADSIWVDVEDKCVQNVSVTVDSPRYYVEPGIPVDITLRGPPNAQITLLAVDEADYILNAEKSLTRSMMFRRMEDFDLGCSPGGGSGNNGVFQDAGVTAISEGLAVPYRTTETCPNSGSNRKKRSIRRRRLSVSDEMDSFLSALIVEDEDRVAVRSRFSWSFFTFNIGPTGELTKRFTMRDSITTWSVQAVGVSRDSGMCVATTTNIRVFRSFFVKVHLPNSVVRNEQVEIMATMYNYMEFRIAVNLYLESVEEICYGARYGQKVFVDGNSAVSVTWPIVPMQIGKYPLKVKAFTSSGSDIVERILHVVPEGKETLRSVGYVLDPSDWQSLPGVPRNNGQLTIRIPLQLPEEAVPGSGKCSLIIAGTELGPVVEMVLDGGNLAGFINRPAGSGETTMLYTSVNVYVAQYLISTSQMNSEMKRTIYSNIQDGYDREMSFRKPHGGFARFTQHDASTWLTAFVLKVFSQAQEIGTLTTDPSAVICQAANWLIQYQHVDGRYFDPSHVYNRAMMGGIEGDSSLTAFITICLESAQCMDQNIKTSVNTAMQYLETQIMTLTRPYTMAIVTYALVKLNSTQKNAANTRLRAMAYATGTTRYWSANVQADREPSWHLRPSSLDVETTAYALLAQLGLGDLEYSHPIVNYLIERRTGASTFVSTQDTVVGLEALSQYSIKSTRPAINMTCSILSGQQPEQFIVSNENALRPKHVDLTDLLRAGYQEVILEVEGQGVAQMQVQKAYNVHTIEESRCNFNLTLQRVEYEHDSPLVHLGEDDPRDRNRQGRNSYLRIRISPCIRYLGQDNSSMAVLEVGLFVGYSAIENTLKELKDQVNLGIGLITVTDKSVIFYLDTVPQTREICLPFSAQRVYIVGLTHPVSVTIYDYLNPDQECTKFYHPSRHSSAMRKLCVGSVCQCAETSCAKCYGYSSGDSHPLDYRELFGVSCNDRMNYALEMKVISTSVDADFLKYKVEVLKVIKAAARYLNGGDEITLYTKLECLCPELQPNVSYYMIGKESTPFVDESGHQVFKYLIDDRTYIMNFMERQKYAVYSKQWNQARDQHRWQRDLSTLSCISR